MITIDLTTGVDTFVGPLGFTNVRGLAFDPNLNRLYEIDSVNPAQLITLILPPEWALRWGRWI